jgi:predicted CoA-binding protein
MEFEKEIEDFLAGDGFAVVGASKDRTKYGNKVLRCYLQNGRTAYPVHPKETEIEGLECHPNLQSVPTQVHGVSIVTPPKVTESVVADAAKAGIRHVWMQPGAESPEAVRKAEELGLSVISGGPCLLVKLGFRE